MLRGGHWRSQSESAARAVRAAGVLDPDLHGEAHAALAFGNAARSACSLGRSPIGGTTNRVYPENVEFALLLERCFYPPNVPKPHGQE